MKKISVFNVGVALLLMASARAAESAAATNQISVDALVADVLEHNPELNFYSAEIVAAKGERRTAGTLANPEVSATLGNKRVSGIGDGVAWSVSAQQTFEWPGRIPLPKSIANQQIKLAELGMAQFKAALAARTRTLAVTLFAAQEKAAAIREVADRFQSLREVLVQRDPAGLTPALETRIIEATELTLHRKTSEAATAEQATLLELNQLRGQSWTQTTKVERPALNLPPLQTLMCFSPPRTPTISSCRCVARNWSNRGSKFRWRRTNATRPSALVRMFRRNEREIMKRRLALA